MKKHNDHSSNNYTGFWKDCWLAYALILDKSKSDEGILPVVQWKEKAWLRLSKNTQCCLHPIF